MATGLRRRTFLGPPISRDREEVPEDVMETIRRITAPGMSSPNQVFHQPTKTWWTDIDYDEHISREDD